MQLEAFLCQVCAGGAHKWDGWVDNWSTDGKDSLAQALAACGACDAANRLALNIVADADSPLLLQPVIPKPAKGTASPAHDVTWRMLLAIVPSSCASESVPATPRNDTTSDEEAPSPRRSERIRRTPTKPLSSAAKTNSPARLAGVPSFLPFVFCASFVRRF